MVEVKRCCGCAQEDKCELESSAQPWDRGQGIDTSCTCSKGQGVTWTWFSAPLAVCETPRRWCGGSDTVKDYLAGSTHVSISG